MGNEVRALSVRQPWAHLILHGGKNVENRAKRTRYRGPVLIQAALRLERKRAEEHGLDPDELKRGAILGVVDVLDCVRNHPSKWAERGAWHWVLANPRPFRNPIKCKGALGLFRPEARGLGQLTANLSKRVRWVD
jgi:ASCH domain